MKKTDVGVLEILKGFNGSLLKLSNILQRHGFKCIGEIGNLDEVIDDGCMIVVDNDEGAELLYISFEVEYLNDDEDIEKDERWLETVIEIIDVYYM